MANYEYLIGADKWNNVIYANIDVREWNNKRTFSASFYSYEPFNVDEFDFEEHYEMWCDGMDKETLYDCCCDYDCAPSELAYNLANDACDVHPCPCGSGKKYKQCCRDKDESK